MLTLPGPYWGPLPNLGPDTPGIHSTTITIIRRSLNHSQEQVSMKTC